MGGIKEDITRPFNPPGMSVSRIGNFFFEPTAGGDKRTYEHSGLANDSNFCFANALVQCLTVFEPFQYLPANSTNATVSNLKLLIDGLKEADFKGDKIVRDLLASITLHGVGHPNYTDSNKKYIISVVNRKSQIKQNDPGELFPLIYRECETDPTFKPRILLIYRSKIECPAPVIQNVEDNFSYPYQSIRDDDVAFITIPMHGKDPINIANFISVITVEFVESEFDTSMEENGETILSIRCPEYEKGKSNHKRTFSYLPTVNTKGIAVYINRNIFEKKCTTALEISDRITFQDGAKFKLMAFLCHKGGSNTSGHYIAYARRNDKWYEFNDNMVTEKENINLRNFSGDVTMVFYNRLTGAE
jgi:hypothetical protein